MRRMARPAQPVAIVQAHMELEWLAPIIWRRVQVPANITLGRLHRVIQAAMGWTDSHLHEFIVGDVHVGIPDDDVLPYPIQPEVRVKPDTALLGRRHFDYLYDFGDNWEHTLRIEKTLPAAPLAHPICIAGENACPPEDVGCAPGYEDFLRIIQKSNDPEHEDMLEWWGGPLDPAAFNINLVNPHLKRVKLQLSGRSRPDGYDHLRSQDEIFGRQRQGAADDFRRGRHATWDEADSLFANCEYRPIGQEVRLVGEGVQAVSS